MMDGFNQSSGALIRKDSIEELCGHRARALELYRLAAETLASAKKAHAMACVGNSSITPPAVEKLRWDSVEDYIKDARLKIDRDMWEAFLVNTPLGSLMDLEERKKFDESLNDPPEITPETVFANLDRLRCDGYIIFRRGLVNCFKNLSRDYRSHDGFKIGSRVILEYIVSADNYSAGWWVRLNSHAEERLRDLDRVMHLLDEKPAPDYCQGLCQAMRDGMNGACSWEATTPYFRIKWHKNGNAHLYFLREDLVRKANLLIAEHYGAAVGAAPDVATKGPSYNPPTEPALNDFYPTPAGVAGRMVDFADIGVSDLILEPSAGDGAILRQLPVSCLSRVTCYEAHEGRAEQLSGDFPNAKIIYADFLEIHAEPRYDVILMNPPFSKFIDVRHVAHALLMLRPGGRLAAIMSGGFKTRMDGASLRLRTVLNRLGAEYTPLPAGTFAEAGTMVHTILVTVTAP